MNMNDSRPVYVQLIDRMYTMILSGEYKPGSRLPTVRELAEIMQANPNTVQRALFYLEEKGLIHTQRTTGKFITEDAGVIEEARKSMALSFSRQYFEQMKRIGVGAEAAKRIINEQEDENGGSDRIPGSDKDL